ncbi:MAG: hypothetical protein M3014_02280 [Chloroflexota bacterium]|nr:hypothetical protein [Chloroflexota bacterium]
MLKLTASILMLLALFHLLSDHEMAQQLPNGTLAKGHIEPVANGSLYVGVLDRTLAPGEAVTLNGPPGFLLAENGTIKLQGKLQDLPWPPSVQQGTAVFLQGNVAYQVSNDTTAPVRYRFLGLGAHGAVADATYEMLPIPWGPGAGKAYDVQIDRSSFPGGTATAWHYHTGPAFGVLDSGTWENRQVDGGTLLIPTPGYYVQPANKLHQLAQVGSGGTVLIIQFSPPGQPLTGGGEGRGAKTPVSMQQATSIAAYARSTAIAAVTTVGTRAPSQNASGAAASPTSEVVAQQPSGILHASVSPVPSVLPSLGSTAVKGAGTPTVTLPGMLTPPTNNAPASNLPVITSDKAPMVLVTALFVAAVAAGAILFVRRR